MTVSRTYTVTLAPDAVLGSLTSPLTFDPATTVPPASAVAAGSPQLSCTPFAATIMAAAKGVTEDISIFPQLLSCGNVPEAQSHRRAECN